MGARDTVSPSQERKAHEEIRRMDKGKVLVIDDSPIVRKLAELALEEEGYKVYTAEDGEEGIKIAEEVLPSIMLVDFIMPKISGYQFCKIVKEKESLRDIPIIIITGKGDEAGRKFVEKFGVMDYFIKPFKSETLVDKVNSIVQTHEMAFGEEATAPVAEEVHEAEPVYGLGIETPLVGQEVSVETLPEEEVVAGETPFVLNVEEVAGTRDEINLEDLKEQEITIEDLREEAATEAAREETETVEPYPLGVEGLKYAAEEGVTVQGPVEEGLARLEMPFAYNLEESREAVAAGQEEKEAHGHREPVTPAATDLEETVDRVVWKYFREELPFLIQKSIDDIFKQSGVVKTSGITLSGDLLDLGLGEVFRLVDSHKLTGKLFLYSPVMSSEIYFDKGYVLYASTSRQGRDPLSGKLLKAKVKIPQQSDSGDEDSVEDEVAVNVRGRIYAAVSSLMELESGSFFFEKMQIPENLFHVPVRLNALQLLLERARTVWEELSGKTFLDGGSIFYPLVKGAENALGLNDDELEILSLIDGKRSLGEIVQTSMRDTTEVKKIVLTLVKTGIIKRAKEDA